MSDEAALGHSILTTGLPTASLNEDAWEARRPGSLEKQAIYKAHM